MAKKEALRELQSRLAQRLQEARTQDRGKSWLAVECGGRGFLFPLKEAGEIFALSPIVAVPHAHAWFLGVANLRGHLHGVVDLAGFLGVKSSEPLREQSRLVAFNASLDINCALLVDRLSGLRSEQQLKASTDVANGPRPFFVGARYTDDSGRAWQELNLAALASDEAFLRIVG
jgi:twitching motility protein PilI